jgi:hypothetical protein
LMREDILIKTVNLQITFKLFPFFKTLLRHFLASEPAQHPC